jgi:hypothetical protein
MKYSNHQEVFFFGCRSFVNNITKLGKYEKNGSINTYRGVEDGLSIIVRLGSPGEIRKAKDIVVEKLEQLRTDRVDYEKGEDDSAIGYLDNERRTKDIALLESFLIRMEDTNNIVEI